MIDDFSIRGIIKGCIDSEKFDSAECKLLRRISDGEDTPEYPEYNPEQRYFYQIGQSSFGPTEYYQYSTIDELIEECLITHGEYPSDVWEED